MTTPGQSAILSGGYSPWQAPLAALFSGISAAAQPGGWSNFGMGVQQGQQNFQQGQQQQQMMDLRRMQIEQAQEEMRRANQEREEAQALRERLKNGLLGGPGSPTPTQAHGGYGAATGGIQTASGAPLAAMFGGDPQKAAIFNMMVETDPQAALQFVAEQQFAEPKKVEASSGVGKIMEDYNNGLIDERTRDALLKKETYIAPQGGADDGAWERYVDPQTGRSGQRNRRTGKIDWDPGNTMMVQTGVDANGNPIFDLVSGSPGPSKEYEAKMANQVTLMEDGINGLEKLVNEGGVSPARSALGEGVSQLGPLGDVLSETLILGPKEKQYAAKRASALESLANTITGAAFTEQQKQNFIAMLPKPTDDDETFKEKLATMRNYMSQLKKNAKVSPQDDGDGWEDVDGVQIRAKP